MSEWKAGFAEVNGARLYYETVGQGLALLMVHAGIAHSGMWDAQFSAFAQAYRALRFDMRGFGQSPPHSADYQRHEDIRALLDELGVERAVLMGCSMGGTACMNFALEYPQRAAALVMVASAPSGFGYPDWSPSPLDEALEAAAARGDLDEINELEMRIFVDGEGRGPQDVDPLLRQRVAAMNRIALENEPHMGQDLPLSVPAAQRLAALALPVLVVVGDLDEAYTQRAADFMVAQIAGAQKVVIPGTAHLPSMERPDLFNAALRDFLAGLDA